MRPFELRPRALSTASFVLSLICVLVASTAQAATISFEPSSAEIACEEQVALDVVIDGVSDLRGFSLEIEFNPTFLSLVSVTEGPDLLGAPCPTFFHFFPYTPGATSFMVDGSGLGCSLSGPARVATVVFEGESEGVAIVDCRFMDLRNSLNLSIPSTCQDASVLVSCPVSSSETGWGALKARWD